MKRRRGLLIALIVVLVVVAGAVYLLADRVRNAPLTIGSSDTMPVVEVTVEASSGEIPAGSPGRDIAFTSNKDGTWDIFLMSADGTLRNLTPGLVSDAEYDYFPSWSMDGKQINFLANRLKPDEMGPSQVNADGSNLQNLDVVSAVMSLGMSGRFDWDPAWSPDGKRLLWSSLRDLNLEMYVVDTGGELDISKARNLTKSGARDWFGAWAPDSTRLTFSSHEEGNENIYLIDLSSDKPTKQLTDSDVDELRAAWSMDGKTLLYLYDVDNGLLKDTIQLRLMSSDGSNQRTLGDEQFDGGAVYAPEGGPVAYMSNADGHWQIYVMNADGSNKRRISEPGADYLYPVWRP